MKTNYVGFGDSDKFLAAVDAAKPVNLSVVHKPGRPDKRFGIAVDRTVIILSQAQGDEVIYFQDTAHRFQTINGQILDRDEDRPARLAAQVKTIVKQYLDDHGVKYREAMLAIPKNYQVLEGHSTFLRYEKESDSFHYQNVIELTA